MTGAPPRPNLRALGSDERPPEPAPPVESGAPQTETGEIPRDAPRPTFPKIFGNYVLEEMLSRGGMAEIYRAQRTGPHSFRKTVALKKILPVLSRNDDFRRLFVEE